MYTDLKNNLLKVQKRIARAAQRAGRDAQDITLLAVTKKVAVDRIREIAGLGIKDLGENRVQELLEKIPKLPAGINWQMIGHLQRNKVKSIMGKVSLIHSLDRWSLAEEIQKRAERKQMVVPVLVQVNVAGEDTKFGLPSSEVMEFLSQVTSLKNIAVRGLMTIAPYVDNPEDVRPVFRALHDLAGEIKNKNADIKMEFLSMGMTNDFEVAVEEGANILRIGSALFGPRNY